MGTVAACMLRSARSRRYGDRPSAVTQGGRHGVTRRTVQRLVHLSGPASAELCPDAPESLAEGVEVFEAVLPGRGEHLLDVPHPGEPRFSGRHESVERLFEHRAPVEPRFSGME